MNLQRRLTSRINSFNRLSLVGAIAMTMTFVFMSSTTTGSTTEEDCALGARYYQLSSTAREEYRQEDALDFLERAVQACPTYYYWQELAELATEFGEPERNERAAEAFVAAHDMATNDKDRARSIARYAEMLFHANDPQNAMTYIIAARNMDPNTPWINDLAGAITNRAANITEEDIKRGLGDMAFKPLKLQRRISVDAPASGGGAGSATPPAPREEPALAQKSVNIPLNFIVNSTELDASTRNNLVILADTLVQQDFADDKFLFVGHADAVGGASANLQLSMRRAQAIYNAIIGMQPTLSGRITTEGKGEQQLLSYGQSAADHRLNRRLEVILLSD
jgi:outer membrane protein OmpA-like peptidoglycan-associated protein